MKAHSIQYSEQEFSYKVICRPAGVPTRPFKRSKRAQSGARRAGARPRVG